MTLTEWLLFVAVIDGPVIGLIWFIWKKIKNEIKK